MLITLAPSPKVFSFLSVELWPIALTGVFSSLGKHKNYLCVKGLKFLNTHSFCTLELREQEAYRTKQKGSEAVIQTRVFHSNFYSLNFFFSDFFSL